MASEEVVIYAFGLCSCSVCTSLKDKEEIKKAVNIVHPTGISSDWDFSKEPTFQDGESNPCPCEQTEGRTHYLMEC